MVKYAVVPTEWGEVLLAGNSRGLCGLMLPPASPCDPHERAQKRWPGAQHAASLLQDLQGQIAEYFRGEYVEFAASVDLLDVGEFQRRVLQACRLIPYGQTVTYAELARAIGQPAAARAVGAALKENPIPLVIPCHRVILRNGALGGFSAEQGVKLKKRLLALEAEVCARLAEQGAR